jgi:predicted transcriptional regulator
MKSVMAASTPRRRARAEDHRDLRHHARRERVAEEDVGVAAERHDAFLDARAAGVVEADHGRAVAHREVHDLADLLRVRLGERAAVHGEVLREHVHEPPLDAPVAGDHAVAVHRAVAVLAGGVARACGDEAVELDEAPLVEQHVESLARESFPLSCCALSRAAPPPSSASARRRSRRSSLSRMVIGRTSYARAPATRDAPGRRVSAGGVGAAGRRGA